MALVEGRLLAMAEAIRLEYEGDRKLRRQLKRLANIGELLEDAAVAGGRVIERETEALAPGRHIYLVVEKRERNRVVVAVGPDKDHWYWRFFEYGAQPHEIGPDTKKALAFAGTGGEMVVRRTVSHPGMAASPFMRPGYDIGREGAVRMMGFYILREIRRWV